MRPSTSNGLRRLFAVALVTTSCSRAALPPEPVASRLAEAADRELIAGDARIRYRAAGSGRPIVLIHGYSRSLNDWFALADSFPGSRVIALDLRGFGRSSTFPDPARYGAAMADDVIRLLDHLDIGKAHLIGHSMGALVAANVVARHPKRVASASLVAGPFHPDSAAFAGATTRWVADLERGAGMRDFLLWLFPGMPDTVAVGMSRATMAENDSSALVATMRSLGALVIPPERLAASKVPVFIAVGSNDPLAPLSRSLARVWTRATFVEVPRVNHSQIITRPETLRGIRALLSQ